MQGLSGLKVIIITINLIAGGAGALAIYSALFEVTVDLPRQEDIRWFIDDGSIAFLATGRVVNNGFYDIEDVDIHVALWNSTDDPLAVSFTHYDRISRGITDIEFIMRLNLTTLAEHVNMVFSDDTLRVGVSVTAKYLYTLITFSARYEYTAPWSALIKEVSIDQNLTSHPRGSMVVLEVPYRVRCSPLVEGISARVHVKLYSSSGELISENASSISLHEETAGRFELPLDRNWTLNLVTHSQELHLRVTGIFAGRSGVIQQRIPWGAPFDGIHTRRVITPQEYIIEYSFTNNASSALDLSVFTGAYDSNGTEIYSSSDRYGVLPSQYVLKTISIPLSAYSNAKKVEFTLFDTLSGMRYSEVVER